MSKRTTAVGIGVLTACLLFLGLLQTGFAADDSTWKSDQTHEKSKPVLKILKPGTLPDKETEASPEARVRAALDSRVEVRFVQTPLNAVCEILAKELDIPVVLDEAALLEMGVGNETPMTCLMKDVRLGAMLDFHLDQIGELTWIIRDEVLSVTTQEVAYGSREIRVYDIADLLGWPGPFDRDLDSLTELISCNIAPTSWGDVGGPIHIPHFDSDEIQALLIPQSRRAHEQIAALFSDLRACLPEDPFGDDKKAAKACRARIPAGERKVRKHLDKKIAVDYAEVPLDEVVRDLEKRLGLEIELHLRSLEEMGIPPDMPVTLRVSGISARAVLNLLLRPVELTYTFRDDFLVILTHEQEEAEPFLRVYDVSDLVGVDDPYFDLLAEALSDSIAEQSGDRCSTYESGVPRLLVVRQTWANHLLIERLLDELRAVRHKVPPAVKQLQHFWKQEQWPPRSPYGPFGPPSGAPGKHAGRPQSPARPPGRRKEASGGGFF